MKMAADGNEYFEVGSVVSCTTCHDEIIQGEVLAFDHITKMLALRSGALSGKSRVQLVNLGLVKIVEVIKERNQGPNQLPNINFDKLRKRVQEELMRKKKSVSQQNVSIEGQRVFLAVTKTIDDVEWDEDKISVLKNVVIRPPYTPDCVAIRESCSNENYSQAETTLQHVKKLVEKHLREEQYRMSNSAESSPSAGRFLDTLANHESSPAEEPSTGFVANETISAGS